MKNVYLFIYFFGEGREEMGSEGLFSEKLEDSSERRSRVAIYPSLTDHCGRDR